MSSLYLSAIRLFFNITGQLAPYTASKAFLYFFEVPRKHKIPQREQNIVDRADISYFPLQSTPCEIAMYRWKAEGPSRGTVLLIHGWASRASQLAVAYVPPLTQLGYTVIGVDMPVHGRSNGTRVEQNAFISGVDELLQHLGYVDVLIGHSMGALCSCLAVDVNQEKVGKVVLLASPSRFNTRQLFYYRLLSVPLRTQKVLEEGFRKKYGEDYNEKCFSSIVEKWRIPGLLIHDENDTSIDSKYSKLIHEHWEGSELLLTQGMGHNKIIWEPSVVQRVIDFIEQKRE